MVKSSVFILSDLKSKNKKISKKINNQDKIYAKNLRGFEERYTIISLKKFFLR